MTGPRTKPDKYVGIDNDLFGGMTTIGKVIRDAWVFELIPETETCESWNLAGIDDLQHKVNAEWDKYGCLVSRLPEELLENISIAYYQAGHMMYTHQPSLDKFKKDVANFIKETSK